MAVLPAAFLAQVAPGVSARVVEATFSGAVAIAGAAESLKSGAFDALYSGWGQSFAPANGYTRHPAPQVYEAHMPTAVHPQR